jgi:CHAD domain-containing protein
VDVTAEHERKLEAPEGFELPELGGAPLEPRVFTSVYYDTEDGSLTRSGITLRRRTEHGRSVWQLKLPAAEARLELEEPGGPAEPPVEIARLLVAHLRHGPVEPVAELRTRRRGALVTRNGTTAEVTIDAVAVMDALRVVSTFVEVEIELRTGDPRQLREIALELEGAGATSTDGTPKLFRVLGAFGAEVGDGAFEVLRARLREQLHEILAQDPGTRLGRDPESLHDMRVAVRRSRALLRTGAPLCKNDLDEVAGELRWLGEMLGAVRDLDVLLARLRAEIESLDVPEDRTTAGGLLRALEGERRRARRALLKALAGERYLALLDRFAETIDRLAPSEVGATLEELARRELKKLRKEARAAGAEPADGALHSLRKKGKRARYAYELAGRPRVVKRAKAFQDVLGAHQDSVVAEERLRALAGGGTPVQALVAGRLIERERALRAEARAGWRRAWRRLERVAS